MTNKAKKKFAATTRTKSGAWTLKSQPKVDGAALYIQDIAYQAAGRIVVGYEFKKPVKTIQSCEVGSSGKRELSSLDAWLPIYEYRSENERLYQEARLRKECMRLLAAQAAQRAFRKKTTTMSLAHDIETEFAIELVARVMGCPLATAETIITVYYIPAVEQLVRESNIWKAIEKIAKALITAPLGYLTAKETNALLARIAKENRINEQEQKLREHLPVPECQLVERPQMPEIAPRPFDR